MRSAAIKAHLAAATAAIVADEGRSDYAYELLDRNDDVLRTDVLDLRRCLEAFAANSPPGWWNRSQRREAHEISERLVAALDQRIAPLLDLDSMNEVTVQLDPTHFAGELMPGTPTDVVDPREQHQNEPDFVSRHNGGVSE